MIDQSPTAGSASAYSPPTRPHPLKRTILSKLVILSTNPSSDHSLLLDQLSQSFVQSGTSLNPDYSILSTSPTAAGYFDARQTRVVILSEPQGSHHPGLSEVDQSIEDQSLLSDFLSNSTESTKVVLPLRSDEFNQFGGDFGRRIIFIGQSKLAELGLISGDYCLIQSEDDQSTSRLARVYYGGRVMDRSEEGIGSDSLLASVDYSERVILTKTKLLPNELPLAQSITISLVGSYSGLKRANQAQLVELIKDYFIGTSGQAFNLDDYIKLKLTQDRTRFAQTESIQLSGSVDSSVPGGGAGEGEGGGEVWLTIKQVDDATLTQAQFGFTIDPTQTRIIQSGFTKRSTRLLVPRSTRLSSFGSVGERFIEYLASSATRDDGANYKLKGGLIIHGKPGVGKTTLVKRGAEELGINSVEVEMFDLIGPNEVITSAKFVATLERAQECAPAVLILKHLNAISNKSPNSSSPNESTQERKLVGILNGMADQLSSSGVILVGTSSDPTALSPNLSSLFAQSFNLSPPDYANRLKILTELTQPFQLELDVSLTELAQRTAALVARDLVSLVHQAVQAASFTLESEIELDGKLITQLSMTDFEVGLGLIRASYSATIGAPKIPSVRWDQIGGLGSVKDQILETIQLPLSQPDLFGPGLKKRSGILLYGPPGTGKTLLAKAVATTCSLNFFSVKGPELLDMYIGESEANVRRVFERAREAKPCVIFFDELDSVAPKRGNQGDSGGVMDRIVSQLLAELDGMQSDQGGGQVFVIGATNRPDLLDPALLRPGRFDKMVYLGLSQTHSDQLNILQALTRDFTLDSTVDLAAIAEQCAMNLSGADLYALCSDAMLKAMTTKANQIDQIIKQINQSDPKPAHPLTPQYYLSELASFEDTRVSLDQRHFTQALAQLVPSVSQAEMEHYETVQRRFGQIPPSKADATED